MSTASAQDKPLQVGRQAVDRFRDLVESGGLASACVVERQTGELVDPDVRALFAALPAVTPATSPDELLGHGLLERLPRALHHAYEQPKYHAGRELFVRTTVSHDSARGRPVGGFDAEGRLTFTHRGVLRGRRGDEFAVEVAGAPSLLRFAPGDVYAWNEPSGPAPAGGVVSGVHVDYNAPLMKAHVCAGYLGMAAELAELDFGAEPDDVRRRQERLVHGLAARVRMGYAGRGDGYAGNRAASLLWGGQGVCFVQRAVAGAYLHAFARVLAFEVQLAVGRTLRDDAPHGFAVVTLRPSMARYVCDPAWGEPLTELRVAFFDSEWGHDRRLVGLEGHQELTVRPFEVDLGEVA